MLIIEAKLRLVNPILNLTSDVRSCAGISVRIIQLGESPAHQPRLDLRPHSPATVYILWPQIDVNIFIIPSLVHKKSMTQIAFRV